MHGKTALRLALILAIALGLAVTGCKKKGDKDKKAEQDRTSKVSVKVGKKKDKALKKAKKALKKLKKDLKKLKEGEKPEFTGDEYKAAFLALASCKFKDNHSYDYKCPAYLALQNLRKEKKPFKTFYKWQAEKAPKWLGHESPVVRYHAAGLLSSAWAGGVKRDNIAVIIAAGEKEKSPPVLKYMLDVIDSSQAKDPRVGAFIVKHTEHEHELVRQQAVWSLAAWGQRTKGAVDAMLRVIKKDKSMKVRKSACEGAGKLEDEKVLPLLTKLTLSKKTDPELYTECFKGVINMWTQFPFPPKKPSKKAYKLTLQLLKQKPRSEKRPPWTISSMFYDLKKEDKDFQKWHATAKFYKKKELFEAFASVIKDSKAGWMIRTYLVDLCADMGAEKKFFKKLLNSYKGKEDKGSNSHVVRNLKKRAG
ncbi:MAG: HEAT repeat domain-containing protein [bacterium]